MDITRILESDHRQVEDLFTRIEKAEGDERLPLIEELTTSLQGHMQLEEEVVYPKMEPATGQEAIEEAETEHELARKTMHEMTALAPDEPGFGAALDALKAGIEHHVEEEEGEVFPKLRQDGKGALEAMATPFMQKRVELGMPIDASSLAASSTKDELVDEATRAGVEGAQSMNKNELAEALTAHMA